MVKVKLVKLGTRENADYPQREKYPDGTVREGYIGNFNVKKNEPVYISVNYKGQLIPIFHTSRVESTVSQTEDEIVFTTMNSSYRLIRDEESV